VYASTQSSIASSGESRSQSTTKLAGKKNQYPCPLAKEFACSDYFTTSGHAARHAKKHTGKKDAFCPECNKAFTRKDNMEHHRRTILRPLKHVGSGQAGHGSHRREPSTTRKPSPASGLLIKTRHPLRIYAVPAACISPIHLAGKTLFSGHIWHGRLGATWI